MTNRRRFLKFGSLGGLLGAAACAVQTDGRRNPYYSGPVSDHFDGTRFFNPGGTPLKGVGDLLRWRFGSDQADWPSAVPVRQTRPEPRVTDLRVTMVGHATLLIQAGGLNLLTDPVWSTRASPFSFAGPARVTAPGIAFEALPPIDAVLLTHNHYDHLDIETLRRLHAAHRMPVITPLGNDTILAEAIEGIDVRPGDWGDMHDVGDARVTLTPCHHWSARGTRDRLMALWSAFLIQTPAGRIFHIGDTGFDDGRPFRGLPEDIRLAILPIGAYAPRWFMKPQHQDPREAVEGFAITGARHAIGHHWGTFQLTDEAREEPPATLTEALAAKGIAPDRFRPLGPGEAWDVPA
ncbi:MBL fold metallo-hydrolase [Jannaschia aquimarina]|uniref:Metal-dependent hydrolase n=1 Tax=Jannaschia aquimarina TaxID=935700 RepID=A0A0D1D2Z8_9RHOB|nr:MBL fold metallo-hydrolase [Jannaschia aquimarina]KIT14483.1 metal-dependent hydrolase [Jannaschia aquimarina]SNT28733.1 L-ascorbate metabolism protein UlaG, beta-lactamase superfamily [Jannaschia aquimarina]